MKNTEKPAGQTREGFSSFLRFAFDSYDFLFRSTFTIHDVKFYRSSFLVNCLLVRHTFFAHFPIK